MATYQNLSDSTDEEFVQRMANSSSERFGEPFWAFFTAEASDVCHDGCG